MSVYFIVERFFYVQISCLSMNGIDRKFFYV